MLLEKLLVILACIVAAYFYLVTTCIINDALDHKDSCKSCWSLKLIPCHE